MINCSCLAFVSRSFTTFTDCSAGIMQKPNDCTQHAAPQHHQSTSSQASPTTQPAHQVEAHHGRRHVVTNRLLALIGCESQPIETHQVHSPFDTRRDLGVPTHLSV